MEEFIWRRTYFVFAPLRMALQYVFFPYMLSFFLPSSIELEWENFSNSIFYAIVTR